MSLLAQMSVQDDASKLSIRKLDAYQTDPMKKQTLEAQVFSGLFSDISAFAGFHEH
jgi:hypothetical protein